ncbi:MAG: hypothetical protein A3F24_00570 [Candidatus Colwellbacteria bacterium RIFCSPHIGHO2_12_FULL_44_17]|uniref:Uncharacterized protein n=1 Tax=Candidatus Colwellbacteria bacterium RIFCSPHIGHO2_12_FULL_44_17 TaxID=1797689 RepID=A0A1G1Z9A7_9BACT|nr:MAG: hypothetical protein A3F24_00570 [Candidatus Colwellbacteria bacterium RIFCSPHIGHO2_12_FULL_44_17]
MLIGDIKPPMGRQVQMIKEKAERLYRWAELIIRTSKYGTAFFISLIVILIATPVVLVATTPETKTIEIIPGEITGNWENLEAIKVRDLGQEAGVAEFNRANSAYTKLPSEISGEEQVREITEETGKEQDEIIKQEESEDKKDEQKFTKEEEAILQKAVEEARPIDEVIEENRKEETAPSPETIPQTEEAIQGEGEAPTAPPEENSNPEPEASWFKNLFAFLAVKAQEGNEPAEEPASKEEPAPAPSIETSETENMSVSKPIPEEEQTKEEQSISQEPEEQIEVTSEETPVPDEEKPTEEVIEEIKEDVPPIVLPTIDGQMQGEELKNEKESVDENLKIFTLRKEITVSGFNRETLSETARIEKIKLNVSLGIYGSENEDDEVLIGYRIGAGNWNELASFTQDRNHSNFTNEGYFSYELPRESDVRDLKVEIFNLSNNEESGEITPRPVLLDAVWIEMEYQDVDDVKEEQVEEELRKEAVVLEEFDIENLPRVDFEKSIIFTPGNKKNFKGDEEVKFELDLSGVPFTLPEKPEEEVVPEIKPIPQEEETIPSEETNEITPPVETVPPTEEVLPPAEITPAPQEETPSVKQPQPESFLRKMLGKLNVFGNAKAQEGIVLEESPPNEKPKRNLAEITRPTISKTEIFDVYGNKKDIMPVIEEIGDKINIRVPKPEAAFRPGRYRMRIEIFVGDKVLVSNEEFTWGVLAINTNKSIYAPSESAYLQMSVLDDTGDAVCNGNLGLTITSPSGTQAYLTTAEKTIEYSGTCLGNNVTHDPDYVARYTTGQTGVYQMRLVNLDNNYFIDDSFEVQNSISYDVERVSATRINPFKSGRYTMQIKVKPVNDFSGKIIERIPRSFEIIESTGNPFVETKEGSPYRTLTWDVSWNAGEEQLLTYDYRAPQRSPEFYLLGPLTITGNASLPGFFENPEAVLKSIFGSGNTGQVDFVEAREWQIASDAQTRVWSSGFENGSNGSTIVAYDEWEVIGSSPTHSSATKRSGGFAMQNNLSATTAYVQHNWAAAGNTGNSYIRFYLNITTGTNGQEVIMRTRDSATAGNAYSIKINTAANNNTLELWDDIQSAQEGSDSSALSTGTWYRIEVAYVYSTKAITAYLNGTQFATGTMDSTNDNINMLRLGVQTSTTANLFFDDVAINSDVLPGSGKIVHMRPNADGDNHAWLHDDGTTGDANNYTEVDEVVPDEGTSYVKRTTNGLPTDYYNLESSTTAGIASTDTITLTAIGTQLGASSTTAHGTRELTIRIKSTGTESTTSNIDPSNTSYRIQSDAQPRIYYQHNYIDPNDSAAWTTSDLDGLQVGITPDITDTTGTYEIRVSAIWVLVEYIPIITVSGNVLNYEQTTPTNNGLTECDGSTTMIKLQVNGTTYGPVSCVDNDGEFSFTGVETPASGAGMVAWIDGQTPNGALVIRYDGSGNSTGHIFWDDSVAVTSDDSSAVTNTNMDVYDSGNDDDIPYSVSSGALTVADGYELHITTGITYAPGGDVTTSPSASASSTDGDIHIDGTGTLDVSSGVSSLVVGGDFINEGTFTAGTSIVQYFTATATGHTITDGGENFWNVTFDGSGGWSFSDSTTIDNVILMNAGTLSGTNDITAKGVVECYSGGSSCGTITLTGGTFAMSVDAARTFGTSKVDGGEIWTFNNLTFEASSSTDRTITINGTGTGNIVVNGTLTTGRSIGGILTLDNATNDRVFDVGGAFTINSSGRFDAAGTGVSFTIAGSFTNSGTFTEGDGTVTLDDGGSGSAVTLNSGCSDITTCTSQDFYNLIINKTDADDADDNVTLSSTHLRVTNTLTITDGELVQSTLNIGAIGASTAISIASAGKWTNISTGDISLGGTVSNAGVINLNGGGASCGDADGIAITSNLLSTDTGFQVATTIETAASWTNFTAAAMNSSNNSYAECGAACRSFGASGQTSDFGFSIPSTATIVGIEVEVEMKSSGSFQTVTENLSLSWNDGANFTSEKSNSDTSGSDVTKTYGGSADTWGRTWSYSEFNNGTLRMKIRDSSSNVGYVDLVQMKVYYTTQPQISWTGAGTFSVADVTVSNQGGSAAITAASSTDSGGNDTNWDIIAGCPAVITVEGTVYSSEGGANIGAGKTVNVRVNGTGSYTDDTDASGIYSVGSVDVESGNVVTVYIDQEGADEGTTIYITDGTSQTNVDIYKGAVIIRADSGSITNDNLYTADDTDDDIKYNVSAASGGTLTVDDGFELHVWTGDTFAPGGPITMSPSASSSSTDGDVHIDGTGVLTMGTNALSVGGDFTNEGTYTVSATQTTTFTATATGHSITDGGENFYNATFSGASGGWSFADSTAIDNTMTITTGELSGSVGITIANDLVITSTLSGSGTIAVTDDLTVNGTLSGTGDITVNGSVTGSGTVTLTNGTFTQSVDAAETFGSTSGTNNWTFNNLTIQASGASARTVTVNGTATGQIIASGTMTTGRSTGGILTLDNSTNDRIFDVNGAFTINSSGRFDAAGTGVSFTIAGSFTNSGIFAESNGTVTLDDGGSGSAVNLNSGCSDADACTDQNFYNLTINKTDADDADDNVTLLTNHLRLTSTLTITDGEFVQGALNVRAEGSSAVSVASAGRWTNISTGDLKLSGSFANAGTVQMDANGTTCGDADSILLRSTDADEKLTFTINDDADQNETGSAAVLTNSTKQMGGTSFADFVGFRITNVTVSNAATIRHAYLKVYMSGHSFGDDSIRVVGEDADDAATFTTGVNDISGRTDTSASATNNVGRLADGYRIWDITAIVQEIIDRGGWASGNDLVIMLDTPNSNFSSTISFVESSNDPEIGIIYGASADSVRSPSVSGTGTYTNPDNGFSSNGSYATKADSTSGSQVYESFGIADLSGKVVQGILVKNEAKVSGDGGSRAEYTIELSWDGGTSWTTAKRAFIYTTADLTQLYGGADAWSHTFIAGELTNSNFKVRVSNDFASGFEDASIDYVSVQVFYSTQPTWSGAGTYTMQDLDISYQGGSASITANSSTDSGNNGANWTINAGGCGISVQGTVYMANESTIATSGNSGPCDGSTAVLSVRVNGGTASTTTCSNTDATFTFSSVNMSAGDTVTIYLTSTMKGNTVYLSDGTADTGIDVYQNTLAIRHENAGPTTIPDIWDYDNTANDTDMLFDAVDATPDTLTTDDGVELHINTGDTFTPGGTVTTSPSSDGTDTIKDGDVHIDGTGVLTMETNALSVGGDFTNEGTFNKTNPQTTTFAATATGHTITDGAENFDSITFNGASGGWSFADATTVDVDLTMTAGTLSGTSDITINGGDVTGDGTITLTGGTFLVDTTGNFGGATGWSFVNLTFGNGTDATTTTATGAGAITVSTALTVAANQILDAASKTWILNGTGTPLSLSGDNLTENASTFSYRGAGATNILNTTYFNLDSKPASGSPTHTLGTAASQTVNASGAMTVGDGTNAVTVTAAANNPTLNVDGNFTIAASGTFTASASATFSVAGSWSTSATGTFTHTSGTVTFDDGSGDGCETINQGATGTGKDFFNIIMNGSGGNWSSTTTDFTAASGGSLTMTAGTLDSTCGSAHVVIRGEVAGTAGVISLTGAGQIFEQRPTSANKNFGTTSGTTAWTFVNLRFSNGGGGADHTITTQTGGSGAINITGILTIGRAADTKRTILDAGNRTWTLSGTDGDPFIITDITGTDGDLTPATSTFVFSGNNGGGNTTIQSETYNILQINNGSETYALESTTGAADLTVTTGTLSIGSNALNITDDLTVNGTLSGTGNTTVNGSVTGSGTINLTGGTFEQIISGGNETFGTNDWYNGSWPYRVKITVQNSKVDADLTDYPVYISLTDLPAGFHTNVNQTDARDIRVTTSDGITEVPREVVFYDSGTDTGELHFKGNVSNLTDTDFYIYYGNTSATEPAVDATYGRNNVWTNGYEAILHLQQGGTTSANAYTDSSGNFVGGTGVADVATNSSAKIGIGTTFDGTGDYIDIGTNSILNSSAFTLSAWINTDTVSKYSGAVTIGDTGATNSAYIGTVAAAQTGTSNSIGGGFYGTNYGTGDTTLTTWKYLQLTFAGGAGGAAKMYVDGTGLVDTTYSPSLDATYTRIGRITSDSIYDFDGSVDEVRIISAERTATWISTEYDNQNSPSTFYNPGAQEGVVATAWTFNNLKFNNSDGVSARTITPNAGAGTITVTGTLTLGDSGSQDITFDNETSNDRDFDLDGSFLIATRGVYSASSTETFAVADDFTNNGTFTHNGGTITLDTTTTATLAGSGSPAITFYNLTVTTGGKTLLFTAGETFRVNGLLKAEGASGNVVNLHSTTTAQWFINHQGTESITYAHVEYGGCDGSSTNITVATTGANGGNNDSCWLFPSLSFTLSSTSASLSLTNSNTYTDTSSTTLTVTTTSTNGYSITAYETGVLTSGILNTIGNWDGTHGSPSNWAGNCISNSECGFGYNTSDSTLSGGTGNRFVDGDSCGADSKCWAGFGTSGPGDAVADAGAPVTGQATTMTYKASVSVTQAAGQYQNTVIYVLTPQF